MNKQEILNEIIELRGRLNDLEKMYNSLVPPSERWRGDKDDKYYFISAVGSIRFDTETEEGVDDSRYDIGNYFQGYEDAEFEAERLKVIASLREWATPPSDFDWDDPTDKKYTLLLESNEVRVDFFSMYQSSDLYFKTKEQALNAIKTVGEDKITKYYFRR